MRKLLCYPFRRLSRRFTIRRYLSSAMCFLSLVAAPVFGQQMNASLVDLELIPADPEEVYSSPFSAFFLDAGVDPSENISASVPEEDTVEVSGNKRIAGELRNIDGNGLAVVDWILVQLRIVPQEATLVDNVPGDGCRSTPACRSQVRVVTKTALLLSDGSVSDADAEDLAEGNLSFDDVDFDPETEDMYIAINHRNHLAVFSGKVDSDVASDGELLLEYDFTSSANSHGVPFGADESVRALAAGDVDGDESVGALDIQNAIAAFQRAEAGYLPEDADLTASMEALDAQVVRQSFQAGRLGEVDF